MIFSKRVYRFVRQIPKGKVTTYGEIARACNSRAFRAVGQVLKANRDPNIPCHRVVRSDGMPGGYNRGSDKKVTLLLSEGIKFKKGKIDRKYFFSFRTSSG